MLAAAGCGGAEMGAKVGSGPLAEQTFLTWSCANMGIRFHCETCQRRLNVKEFLAGKRGICPHCQAKIMIPSQSTVGSQRARAGTADSEGDGDDEPDEIEVAVATLQRARPVGTNGHAQAPVVADAAVADQVRIASTRAGFDPIQELPDAVWYMRTTSDQQFGPARGPIMRKWLDEGRVSADALVWREGWREWKTASDVFGELSPGIQVTWHDPTDPARPTAKPEEPVPNQPSDPGPGISLAIKPAEPTRGSRKPAIRSAASDALPAMSDLAADASSRAVRSLPATRRSRPSNSVAIGTVVALGLMSVVLLMILVFVLRGT